MPEVPWYLRASPPPQSFSLGGRTWWVQRDDLLDPHISGNKARKLLGWRERLKQEGKSALISFGGAYSNHLVALAAAAREEGWRSLAILRGEEVAQLRTPSLQFLCSCGMHLFGVSRSLYRDKEAALASVLEALPEWKAALVVPEGGSGAAGQLGFAQLVGDWLARGFEPSAIWLASATGTTAVGLWQATAAVGWKTRILAVPVLRNLPEQMAYASAHGTAGDDRLQWITGYDGGGYAKIPPALAAFTSQASLATGIPLEPIYTGKALWALYEEAAAGRIAPADAAALVFLHTGGLAYCQTHSPIDTGGR